jgi:hypothetical protein
LVRVRLQYFRTFFRVFAAREKSTDEENKIEQNSYNNKHDQGVSYVPTSSFHHEIFAPTFSTEQGLRSSGSRVDIFVEESKCAAPAFDEHFTLSAVAGFSSINNTVWFLDATTALTVMLLVDRRWLSGNILIVMIVFSTIFYDPLTALALFGIFVLTDEPPNPRAN